MLKEICVEFENLEMMLFYWESIASKDKMSDEYFIGIAQKPHIQVLYNDAFSADSFRRVLSSIANREKLNNQTPLEAKFWNQNMRMIEDLNLTRAMLSPIKTLNLSELKGEDLSLEKLTVAFIPFPEGDYIASKDCIYFNFFNIIANYDSIEEVAEDNPKINVSLHGKSIKDFVIETVRKTFGKN